MDEKLTRGVRRGGKWFWAYQRVNGKTYERWVSKDEFMRRTQQNRERTREKYRSVGYANGVMTRAKTKYNALDLRVRLVYGAKIKAVRAGLPFDLTPDDLPIVTHCPIFGWEFEPVLGGAKGPRDKMATLDQVVRGRGYIKGNVEIISFRANRLKNTATPEELRMLAAFYTSRGY